MSIRPLRMVPYQEEWPQQFKAIGNELRQTLGDTALRIDHIGSTSITGMAAKPIIDIQISVASLYPANVIVEPIVGLDYEFREHNPDLTRHYFRDRPLGMNVHIHVRVAGSHGEQLVLLYRDYLRNHPFDAAAYGDLKIRLVEEFGSDRIGYGEAKRDFIFEVIKKAHLWTMEIGWFPGPPDI